METLLETKNAEKRVNNFHCECCDYYTVHKYDFTRHQSTRKHASQSGGNKMETKTLKNAEKRVADDNQCEKCQKVYKTRSGLWKHQRLCLDGINNSIIQEEVIATKVESQPIIDKDMFMELIKQNKEIQNVLVEQNNKLMEELKDTRKIQNTITNTTTNTNSNNNNRFNLNLFLNEQCKDALNLNEFISSLKVTVEDLERTGKLGYVEGISNIFLNGLRELDIYTRPIHCTDLKRETVYVKDKDKWEKDTEDKSKLKQAVNQIATKNLKQLKTWQEENPEFSNCDSKENEQYMIISKSSLGGYDKEEDEKYKDNIIRNVLKETKVPG